MLPDVTTAVTLGAPVVRLWDDAAEDWAAATYKKRPGGRVRVSAAGEYDISVDGRCVEHDPARGD